MAVVLFIHHHQPPGHLACNRSRFTPRACPPAPSCDHHQLRPQRYQHHHFPHHHQIAAARNHRRRPTTTTGLHLSADNNAHGSTPPPLSRRRRPGDDHGNKADGDDDVDNKNKSDSSPLSSSQSAFIIPLPRATLTMHPPASLDPHGRHRRRRLSNARKPGDAASSTASVLSDSTDADASIADSNDSSDSNANNDTNSSTSSSSRPSATSAGRNALNRRKPLDHNNNRHGGRGNNSSNNNNSSINSSGNNNSNKRGSKKAGMNPTYFTMTTDYSDWSSDFLTLCNEQLSLLMDTMPDVRLVALFFRHENEAEGALEFVPLIVHSCDPEENKPARVWISSGAGGGLTELENKDVNSRVLPGGVPANWILPDYPFTSESHHGGILLPDGGLCVPVEYNDVIAGTIIIRPKVAWSTTATSTTTTLNGDDDDDDDDNDMPKSRWSVSDIRRVDLVARSIALAAALEGKWHAYKGLLGTTRTLLESVRSLLRTTLHQIRSPLQALVTFGNLMMRKLPVKDSNRDLAKHVIVEALRVDELLKPLDEAREKLVLPEAPPKQHILSNNESLKRAFDTHPEMLFEDFGLASVDVEKRRAAAAARRSAASAAAARRGSGASQLGAATGRQQQQQPRRRSRGRGQRAGIRDERDDDDDDVFGAFRGEQDDDDFFADDDEDDEDFDALTDDDDNLRPGSTGANARRKPRGSAGAARALNGSSKRSTGRRTKASSRSPFSARASGRRLNSPLPPAFLSESEGATAGEDDNDDELPEMFAGSYYDGDDDEQEEDRDSSLSYMDAAGLDTEYASTRDGLQLLWLADVLQAQLERAQVLANSKGLRFHARLTADSGPVMAVGKFVREAMSNLLDNAIKYSPRGAHVGVTSVDMDIGVGLGIMEEGTNEEEDDADDVAVADADDSNDSADGQQQRQQEQQQQQQRPRGRQRRQRKERDGRRLFDLPPDSCGVVVWDTGYGFQAEEMGRVWEYGFRGSVARRTKVGGSGLGLGITEQLLRSCAATVELVSPLPRALDPRRDSERAANPQLKGAAFVITFRKPTRKVRDSTNAETRAVDFFEDDYDDYAEEDDEVEEDVEEDDDDDGMSRAALEEGGGGGGRSTTDSGTGDGETEQRVDADAAV